MADYFIKHMLKWLPRVLAKGGEKRKSLYSFSSGTTPTTHLSVVFDEIGYRVNKLLRGKSISEFLERRRKNK